MRVLLRNKKTRLYYAEFNQMAGEHNQAREFTSVPHAARFALAEGMPEVEIIVRCDYLAREVTLQPLPEWCEMDQGRPAAPAARPWTAAHAGPDGS
jgi:hypothetical protein